MTLDEAEALGEAVGRVDGRGINRVRAGAVQGQARSGDPATGLGDPEPVVVWVDLVVDLPGLPGLLLEVCEAHAAAFQLKKVSRSEFGKSPHKVHKLNNPKFPG